MKTFVDFRAAILIAGFLFFVVQVNAQNNFRDIVPFVTTQEQVEKKLGKPNEFGSYELDEGRVFINYREYKCDETRKDCFCLAPLGTVLNVRIQPSSNLQLKDLKLDSKQFEKTKVKGHAAVITNFFNKKSGVLYEVRDEKVTEIRYYVSEATCKTLQRKISKEE